MFYENLIDPGDTFSLCINQNHSRNHRGLVLLGEYAIFTHFHGRAHNAVLIKVKAKPVTVTVHRAFEFVSHLNRDLAIIVRTHWREDRIEFRIAIKWRTDFPGLRRLFWVKLKNFT